MLFKRQVKYLKIYFHQISVKPQQAVASPQKKILTSGGPSPATPSSQQSTLKSRPSTMPRQQEGSSDREDLPVGT